MSTLSFALLYQYGTIDAFNVCVQTGLHGTSRDYARVRDAGTLRVGAVLDFRSHATRWRAITLTVSGDAENPTWNTLLDEWSPRPTASLIEQGIDELLVPFQSIRGACMAK